jgi:hypothetical protein
MFMEETPMTNKQIIEANKKNIPFRVGDRVEHVIAEHNDGAKEIWWVSKAADRKEQTLTFADAKSNEVSAYLYTFAKEV